MLSAVRDRMPENGGFVLSVSLLFVFPSPVPVNLTYSMLRHCCDMYAVALASCFAVTCITATATATSSCYVFF